MELNRVKITVVVQAEGIQDTLPARELYRVTLDGFPTGPDHDYSAWTPDMLTAHVKQIMLKSIPTVSFDTKWLKAHLQHVISLVKRKT